MRTENNSGPSSHSQTLYIFSPGLQNSHFEHIKLCLESRHQVMHKTHIEPPPFLGPLRRECVPQATMCMVMVGIDPELSDELKDQTGLF